VVAAAGTVTIAHAAFDSGCEELAARALHAPARDHAHSRASGNIAALSRSKIGAKNIEVIRKTLDLMAVPGRLELPTFGLGNRTKPINLKIFLSTINR
jgi:hypothetical protein